VLCFVVYTCFVFCCINAVLRDRCWFCCSVMTATIINEDYYYYYYYYYVIWQKAMENGYERRTIGSRYSEKDFTSSRLSHPTITISYMASSLSPALSCITHSLFHSCRLKSYLFHKAFQPEIFLTCRTDVTDSAAILRIIFLLGFFTFVTVSVYYFIVVRYTKLAR